METEDFEMGGNAPKINKYNTNIPPEPKVNPKGSAPVAPTAPATPIAPASPQRTIGQVKKGITAPPVKPVDPEARKKAVLGCLGGFGAVMLLLLAFAFYFVASSGESESPIAKLLNVNQATFVNSLITLVHVVFILVSLVAFVFTMVGLFKTTMAKKDDKLEKKAGLKMSLVAGIILAFILICWMFVYVYLDAKRVQVAPTQVETIITDPEETLNLTAPIEIKFDASNVKVDKNKFQIIYYEWDFGDGETGTSQIVSHRYEEKGNYDVILTVTKKDKKTAEELKDTHTVKITIDNQALTASFTADPQSGEAPLDVKFDASASVDPDGNIKRYEWDLDEDGEFDDADGAEIEHTFEKIGRYTVSLRVVSTTGEFEITEKEIIVEEQVLPEAVITIVGEPENFETGVSYTFKADESTSPNGKIEKYAWEFSDSSKTEETKSVSHVFKAEGTYEVTLKVTDDDEEEGEVTMTIEIGLKKGSPKAVINSTPDILEGKVPFEVEFDASSSTDPDNNIVDYEWDFDGDGEFDDGVGKKITHTFTDEGTFDVGLLITDSDDNKNEAKKTIKIESKGITAFLEADKIEGVAPMTVQFDASGSSYPKGQITSYRWDFGDGSASKLGSAKISHKYTEIGTYTASVEAIGSDNTSNKTTLYITVRETPLSACFQAKFEEGPAPLETSFDPGCTTGTVTSYFWDFGDGTISSDAKPTHTFQTPKTYTVRLEITDSENTVSKAEAEIKVTQSD